MSWVTAYLTWSDSDTPTPSDFNRIEGNTDYLKDAVDSNDSDILSAASAIASGATRLTTLEGSGSIQGVGTTNAVTFATVNTGQGDNELYPMNQSVRTTDSPTFSELTVNGPIEPDSSPLIGGITSTIVLPRGIYNFANTSTVGKIQMFADASWRDVLTNGGGCIFSDGTNVRAYLASPGVTTLYYQRY